MPKPVQASTYTFRNLIEGGFLYVDKTRYLYALVHPTTGIYFLARPRRFGKSLMLSTLEEIFLGNRALFKGLWIDSSDYDWRPYPVIRFDFSSNSVNSAENLERFLDYYIAKVARTYGVTLRGFDYQSNLVELIEGVAQTGKVVLLIDEYDKPLIDHLQNLSEAVKIREVLKKFYTVIKAMDRHLRFVFITGISKFSKVGVFSAMNNLTDLTMNAHFATALGITEEELTTCFQEHIAEFAHKERLAFTAMLAKIREWYNGFCFVEECAPVYNPFSTLQLFFSQRFSNYWFDSGTPTFLIKLLQEQQYDIEQLDDLHLRELAFSTYELENLSIVPLLFQTGYLTIKDFEPQRRIYTLSYPNTEVKDAFLAHLLGKFSERDRSLNENYLWQLVDALEAHDLDQFFRIMQIFFANVPYNIHLKHEKYYQTIFYLIFKLLGLRVEAEVYTNQGRIDAVVEVAKYIYLFEFKLDKNATEALQQIKKNAYYQKYRHKAKPLTLIGANFDSSKRQVTEWRHTADVADGDA
ncbi:MAG: ATP-binding protein [Caldilineaceae bacterium]